MSAAVLPRLAVGWVSRRNFLSIVSVTFGLGVILVNVRRGFAPPDGPHGIGTLVWGAIAFLGSGAVSALIASQWAALRACPFAWNTPGMLRMFPRALRVGALVTVPLMAALGALIHGAVGCSMGFLPAMSAAGYAVGVVNTAETKWALRMGGLLALVLASAPVLLGPEMDHGMRGWSLAWAGGACVVLAMVIRQGSVTRSLERVHVDPGWGGSWAEYSVRQWKARRGGAAPGGRTRCTTADWVQALRHATIGTQGGAVRAGLRIAVMVILGLVWVRLVILLSFPAGAAPMSEGGAANSSPAVGAPAWVARFVRPDSDGAELLTILACGLGLVIMSCTLPSVPALGVRFPLARSRWARVLWWRTQIDECAWMLISIGTLAVLGLALSRFAGEAAWANIGTWMKGLVAMFALLPLARVARMLLIRESDPFSSPLGLPGPGAWTAWAGIVICSAALLLGTKLTMVGWDETMLHLRAELPAALRPWTALLAIPPIVVLRWLWLRVLVRHCRTCDLDAA